MHNIFEVSIAEGFMILLGLSSQGWSTLMKRSVKTKLFLVRDSNDCKFWNEEFDCLRISNQNKNDMNCSQILDDTIFVEKILDFHEENIELM